MGLGLPRPRNLSKDETGPRLFDLDRLPGRLWLLAATFFAEKTFLNVFVDFDRAQESQGVGALLRIAQHWGFRFLVAFAAALALLGYVRRRPLTATTAVIPLGPPRWYWVTGHFLLVAVLAPLSYALYRDTSTDLSLALVAALWILVGTGAALSVMFAMAPRSVWLQAGRSLGNVWIYAGLAAFLGTALMQASQSLWGPTAVLTFDLARLLLRPFTPDLVADPVSLVLSTGRFAVQITYVCSGLEGVGLMLAFAGTWLIVFRHEYIFPRALLLIPGSMAAIYALNVVRIALLVFIGDAGFPDIAVYGFHSQAGWIAFNAVACVLVFLSRRSPWLNRTASTTDTVAPTGNPVSLYLMPLLAILAAGALSHALSGRFETLYPLRLIAAVATLIVYRRRLWALDWRWSWRGPMVGALVFVIWVWASQMLILPSAMPDSLAAMSPAARQAWIATRLVAALLIVPIAEELAYRGYLMRRLTSVDFESVPYRAVSVMAITLTAVAFGAVHGALWAPGILAGMAYGFLAARRGSLGEAVAAHAITNGLLAVTVLAGSQWQLW